MDRLEIDKYLAKLFNTNSNPKNERSGKNAAMKSSTNTASTSNVRSTSAKSKKTTTNIPQKGTVTRSKRTRNEANSSYNSVHLNNASDEDEVVCRKRNKPSKAVKRLKPTSTNNESDANTIFNGFNNCNGAIVSSTPKINPVVLLERHERELNMDELSPIVNDVTLRNKSSKVTSSECSQDSELTENVQTVLQTSQNNVENNLIDDSVIVIDEIPARNRRGRNNNPIPLNDVTIITIPEDDDDDDSDVVIIDGPSTSSFVRRRTTKYSRKEKTNKHKINNEKYPETPKTTNVTMDEEENNDSQAEVTLEGLRSCPICLESFKNKEVSATICGHIFCKGCILAVIATNKKCPTCRMSLTKKKIHPLFI